jgi:hypothetical protein
LNAQRWSVVDQGRPSSLGCILLRLIAIAVQP